MASSVTLSTNIVSKIYVCRMSVPLHSYVLWILLNIEATFHQFSEEMKVFQCGKIWLAQEEFPFSHE